MKVWRVVACRIRCESDHVFPEGRDCDDRTADHGLRTRITRITRTQDDLRPSAHSPVG